MKVKEGDILKFRLTRYACLMRGLEGVCRIDKFEQGGKRRPGKIVYMDIQTDEGGFSPFGRYWPEQIEFAPVGGGEYQTYLG
jgi:hypothetical protein